MNRIKTVIILTAVLFTGVLSISCSSDDNKQEATIVGVWKKTSEVTENFKNNVSIKKENGVVDANNLRKFTFNTDGRFSDFEKSSGDLDSTDPGTYTIDGNVLSMTYDGGTDIEKFTFNITDNQLALIFTEEYNAGNDVMKYVITSTYSRQ